MKKRIDLLLVERGLAESREKAQALVLSGEVLANDVPVAKPGQAVDERAELRVRHKPPPYVSRGGIKLAAALDAFSIPVSGRAALDIGASTGGFTHVLLLRGALRVFAVDVGHNQLDWRIRKDRRVIVREGVNARNLEFSVIGGQVDLIVIDVSFISLEKILPAAIPFSHSLTDWVTLIKPQFEVGKGKVGKGGIVRDEADRQAVIERLTAFGETLGLTRKGLIESPITGTQGNREFLAHWKRT
jgi:23S rRNA (cytidine1920-2'-O)/16S rRNA (cytidine1409-2'-O)-methyltransferase